MMNVPTREQRRILGWQECWDGTVLPLEEWIDDQREQYEEIVQYWDDKVKDFNARVEMYSNKLSNLLIHSTINISKELSPCIG